MVKTLIGSPEFDKNPERKPNREETEAKYQPLFADHFNELRERAVPIEQVYLSHPMEPFNLRLRETYDDSGKLAYTATLKDRGVMTSRGLKRMEIETEVSDAVYRFYRDNEQYPRLRKLRANYSDGVTVDWLETAECPVIECEITDSNTIDVSLLDTGSLVNVTGDLVADSERQAHLLYRRQHGGNEALVFEQDISPNTIAQQIIDAYRVNPNVVITIGGRSGSGKSTFIRAIKQTLQQNAPELATVTLSTDDYHRGKTYLETTYGAPWTNWDAAEVYDVNALAFDLWQLQRGEAINGRRFNFATQEPELTQLIQPGSIVIVEGIYASSPLLNGYRTIGLTMPTPLATSIGRRLKRDIEEGRLNTSLGTPEDILRYQLETAEPAYQLQQLT